jgi:putative ABC transport system permease protein
LEWKDFEGKRFDRIYEVVGVVKNFNVKSLHTNIDPLVIFYKPRNGSGKPFFSTLSVRLSPGHTGEQLRMIKQVWKRFVPNEPMSFMFYDDQFQSMYEKEERLAQSISFFSLVALALTCMGILGHIFMICLNRVKEIGIRKVNGSKIWEIMLLLMKDSVRSVLISLILATPISYYIMSKWLENFAYKTTLSWWIFVLAGFSTLLIVLLTVSWQSWKAASTNPLEALRYE